MEPPLKIKPNYDDMVRWEDPVSKEFTHYKRPSERAVVESKKLPAKDNWKFQH